MNAPYMRIGQLAATLGINPKTIRYYEEIGLLPAAERGANGYRLYDRADRERLRFIAQAKAVGLSLEEIAEILSLRAEGSQPCEHLLELLDEKLKAIAEQMQSLLSFQQNLLALREEASQTRGAEACVCGIIELHKISSD
jgi:MerR family Zn(II)-responsive transcriptional regulator of zntA